MLSKFIKDRTQDRTLDITNQLHTARVNVYLTTISMEVVAWDILLVAAVNVVIFTEMMKRWQQRQMCMKYKVRPYRIISIVGPLAYPNLNV